MAYQYKRGSAKLSDIKYNCRVGSEAWFRNHTLPAQWLSVWRRSHMAPMAGRKDAHAPIRSFARGKGLKPSSLTTIKENMIFQAGKLGVKITPKMTEKQIGKAIS